MASVDKTLRALKKELLILSGLARKGQVSEAGAHEVLCEYDTLKTEAHALAQRIEAAVIRCKLKNHPHL
jgi:hypothetical protein